MSRTAINNTSYFLNTFLLGAKKTHWLPCDTVSMVARHGRGGSFANPSAQDQLQGPISSISGLSGFSIPQRKSRTILRTTNGRCRIEDSHIRHIRSTIVQNCRHGELLTTQLTPEQAVSIKDQTMSEVTQRVNVQCSFNSHRHRARLLQRK